MKDYEGSRIWKPSDFLEMSVQRASDSSVLYDAVADFVTTKRLEQKSARTVSNYQYDLKTFLQVVGAQTPMANISPQMVKQYLLLSQQRPGPYSHFSRYRSLRVFFNWCVREGYLPSNPLTVRPPKLPQRVMPIFSDADLRAMVDACTESTALRDRALLLVLMDTGMRLNEVVYMRAEHISWEEGALHVYGKGNKERIVVPSRPTLLAIYRYLDGLALPLREKGLKVQCATMIGHPAESIVSHAEENGFDLVALATHGRSGLRRLVFGSVADYVIRKAGLPILLIKPK